MVTSAIPGWSGIILESLFPELWGWLPAISGLLVFVASVQRQGHALGSSDAERTSGPVTVFDHLRALMGVSKER